MKFKKVKEWDWKRRKWVTQYSVISLGIAVRVSIFKYWISFWDKELIEWVASAPSSRYESADEFLKQYPLYYTLPVSPEFSVRVNDSILHGGEGNRNLRILYKK